MAERRRLSRRELGAAASDETENTLSIISNETARRNQFRRFIAIFCRNFKASDFDGGDGGAELEGTNFCGESGGLSVYS